MLSRVADSLYWMSRYLERAENTVRQLDVTMNLMLDTASASAETRWNQLVAALGNPDGLEWNGDLDAMAGKLVFDTLNRASVTYCINAARENARQVREEISTRAVAAPQSPLSPDALGPGAVPVSGRVSPTR